jgi:predicted nucleic-acid-binding protein
LIGLDTNILLRATLDDDPVQSPVAQQLMRTLDDSRLGFVNISVLLEYFWVLDSRYKVPRPRLVTAIKDLLELEYLQFESFEVVGQALAAYDGDGADFADAVIALRNRAFGAETTFTFDEGAARKMSSMEFLA